MKKLIPYILKFTIMSSLLFTSCTHFNQSPRSSPQKNHVKPNTIISSVSHTFISYDDLISDLSTTGVVYIGESHLNPAHHEIQRRIIESLLKTASRIDIGMEMFDVTYQPLLDKWSQGQMTLEEFIHKSNWYANWRYDHKLYTPILELIQQYHLKAIALNILFCLPPKIATGGIASLSADERKYLPRKIDLKNSKHRQYIQKIYNQHHFGDNPSSGRDVFEYFYQAQCVWDDHMAQVIASNGDKNLMVVLIGKGHIIQKFGVPDRAYQRNPVPFKTIYLQTDKESVNYNNADYIWITPGYTLH